MRYIKMFGCFILSTALLFCYCEAVEVSARSAILYETETGKVLFEKNINNPMGIASTTKIMTAVVVLDHINLKDIVTVKASCTGIEGSSMYLKPGERIPVLDLLYGLMLVSGNDAAVSLADYVGKGDVSRFIAMMNEKAEVLGLKNTHFQNPNGLPAEGHYSSALDMAKLTAYAMSIPKFREIVSRQTYSAGGRFMKNHNRLLKMYKGTSGVKTGFTKAAGRCLVSSAERDNIRLVAVTLYDPDDWDDHMRLYDFGFQNYSRKVFANPGETIAKLPVVGGSMANINVRTAGELFGVLSNEELQCAEMKIILPRFLYAPIEKGTVIGELLLNINGKTIGRTTLISENSASFKEKTGFWENLLHIFKKNKYKNKEGN